MIERMIGIAISEKVIVIFWYRRRDTNPRLLSNYMSNICLFCLTSTVNPRFCSKSCAAKYNNSRRSHTIATKTKISRSIKKLVAAGSIIVPHYCSKGKSWKKPPTDEWTSYNKSCKFYTPFQTWPLLEGYELLLEKGWWNPTNKGGVVRDHKFSIKQGFDEKIPFNHICHLANCRLITHDENNQKGRKSSISYEELKHAIAKLEQGMGLEPT